MHQAAGAEKAMLVSRASLEVVQPAGVGRGELVVGQECWKNKQDKVYRCEKICN